MNEVTINAVEEVDCVLVTGDCCVLVTDKANLREANLSISEYTLALKQNDVVLVN